MESKYQMIPHSHFICLESSESFILIDEKVNMNRLRNISTRSYHYSSISISFSTFTTDLTNLYKHRFVIAVHFLSCMMGSQERECQKTVLWCMLFFIFFCKQICRLLLYISHSFKGHALWHTLMNGWDEMGHLDTIFLFYIIIIISDQACESSFFF